MRRIALRDVNWIGEGALDRVLDAGRIEVFVKVRSTRPPRAALLSATAGGYEIELVDGEDGVSPGQACVFYDSAEGQARVLGGGFIRAAAATAQSGLSLAEGAMGAGARPRHDREGLCALGAGLRPGVRRGVRARPQAAIAAAEEHVGPGGGRILEVGVGTGISLLSYAATTASSASTSRRRCCARRRSASPSTG